LAAGKTDTEVAQLLNFYAIQVVDPESHADARAFRAQMQTILELYREELGDKGRGGYVTLQDKNSKSLPGDEPRGRLLRGGGS
jgi:hypothetical protein